MHQGHDDCCRGKVFCKKPKHARDIKTECIFVEKVFDSRVFRTQEEVEQREEFTINKCLTQIIPGTLNVSCEVEEFRTRPQIWINGKEVDTSCPFPGPGGVKQFDLSNIDVDMGDCTEKGKGKKVNVKQRVKVWFKVFLKITGQGIEKGTGNVVEFESRKKEVCGDFRFKSKFKMCMPNNKAVFPVSIAEACGANCFFDIDRSRIKPSSDDVIQVEGDIRFCIRCEKKIKAAVELCILTTGFCKEPEVEFGICNDEDFPDLFPFHYLDDGGPVLFMQEEEVEVIEEPIEEEIVEELLTEN